MGAVGILPLGCEGVESLAVTAALNELGRQVSEHIVASTTYSDTVKAKVSCKCVIPARQSTALPHQCRSSSELTLTELHSLRTAANCGLR